MAARPGRRAWSRARTRSNSATCRPRARTRRGSSSAGNGDMSRIYHTTNGGRTWSIQFVSTDQRAFFDCIAFWDAQAGDRDQRCGRQGVHPAPHRGRRRDLEPGERFARGGRGGRPLRGERHLPAHRTRWTRLVRHRRREDRAGRAEPRTTARPGRSRRPRSSRTRPRLGSRRSPSGTRIAGSPWVATSTSRRSGRRTSRSARTAGRPGRLAEAWLSRPRIWIGGRARALAHRGRGRPRRFGVDHRWRGDLAIDRSRGLLERRIRAGWDWLDGRTQWTHRAHRDQVIQIARSPDRQIAR